MRFGRIALDEALGALLAHAVQTHGKRFKKGHCLTASDITQLKSAGHDSVIAAVLEAGDVEENEAARQVGERLATSSITAKPAFTGRVNLHADRPGMFFAQRAGMDALNRICDDITVASLPDGTFVEAGRMVATVKIIPLAVSGDDLSSVCHLVSEEANRGMPLIAMQAARSLNVGLIQTQLSGVKDSVLDKTALRLSERLQRSASKIVGEQRIAHDSDALGEALVQMSDDCDIMIVFGASAITDRRDVIPAGLEAAGGELIHLGMPVDPGNLLMMGRLAGKPVIGAPGCARSPSENGFDWVLDRLVCGVPVDRDYTTGLGVGGLLMEITERPQPREG